MSGDIETPEPPKKGRGNAILTYETVEGIKISLAEIKGDVKNIVDAQVRHDEDNKDHEARLRVQETKLTAYIAGTNANKGQAQWMWSVILPLGSLILQASIAAFTVSHMGATH